MAGHPITPTTVRLLGEASSLLRAGHPAGLGPADGLAYGAVSAVGGPHGFDGFFLLAVGGPGQVARLHPRLEAFDHDALQRQVLADHAAESAQQGVPDTGPLALAWVGRSEPDGQGRRQCLGLAADAEGRHTVFTASQTQFEALRRGVYVGTPIRLDAQLRLAAAGPAAWGSD